MTVRIRVAMRRDLDEIRDVHLRAFPEVENRAVETLAAGLLSEETSPETIALVAEIGGEVVGHVAFSPVVADANKDWLGYILAPLGVKPAFQEVGIGSKLVESGIVRLSDHGVNVLFVYGDPEYYRRFGFKAETATGFLPPYELKYPFGWQGKVLNEGGGIGQAVRLSCVRSLCDPALW